MELLELSESSFIRAKSIDVSNDCSFGQNINIDVNGTFKIGKRCRFGDNIHIRGNNIEFGDDLFCSGGLRIGGGGRDGPKANFRIGDRCTIHNNFINVAEPVRIGNDVGLSPDVAILTHGYWQSVFEGYPATFAGVVIRDGAIIGYRSVVLMGVTIGQNCVIGANSTVTKDIPPNTIWAGNPARQIRAIEPLPESERKALFNRIIKRYASTIRFRNLTVKMLANYPMVYINRCEFNLNTMEMSGTEDDMTDDFRDYIRRWGFRFYTDRPHRSVKRA